MGKKKITNEWKRHRVQILWALLTNSYLIGFVQGKIYKGKLKNLCVPGLNCYSCPGAVFSCPLGSLQSALLSSKYRFPYYMLGMLLLFGILLGRVICGFLCPFGLVQELLYKIPTKKLQKNVWTRRLSRLKYVILAVFVILIPLVFLTPGFCKYICPAGTLEGGFPLLLKNESLRRACGQAFSVESAASRYPACLRGFHFPVLLPVFLSAGRILRTFFIKCPCSVCGSIRKNATTAGSASGIAGWM